MKLFACQARQDLDEDMSNPSVEKTDSANRNSVQGTDNKNRRKICVITSTRADYGHLFWILKDLEKESVELQILATGTHLSDEFGNTQTEITRDGFVISEKVKSGMTSDQPIDIAKSLATTTVGIAESLQRLKPDMVVVLGDRFEILGAAQAAHILNIPIAHIHGGETTEGAIDEAFRHSITKMSQLHFVVSEPYRKRVIQLGENPDHVLNFGAPSVDHLFRSEFLSKSEFEEKLGLKFKNQIFVVTFHPVTLSPDGDASHVQSMLGALAHFTDSTVVITGTNSDTFGRSINTELSQFADSHSDRVRFSVSLGHKAYLSLLKIADLVIGNSSSGIIEAPSIGVPTINIGPRQKGRLRTPSILDVDYDSQKIKEAIELATSQKFRKSLESTPSPYGNGGASLKIAKTLATVNLSNIMNKHFYDL